MKLEVNTSIKTDKNIKVFCQEDYAEELFNKYKDNGVFDKKFTKDIEKNEILEVTSVTSLRNNLLDVEVNNMSNITIDLYKEKKFFDIYNITQEEFKAWILSDNGKDFISKEQLIFIENSKPVIKGSLFLGHLTKQRKEFFEQINKPTTAYVAKIKDKNNGGFLVEVMGIDAFLPGSLAAANKIVNFDSYIGKEIPVMIEDYLKEIKTFIVSNKKYITNVLPMKAKNFDLSIKHKGTITGVSKFGIFAEFEDIFTGLLHKSKMKEETINLFNSGQLKPDDTIECWVKEIGEDSRLILSDYSIEETVEIEKAKKEEVFPIAVDESFEGVILSVKQFGSFVKIEKEKIEYIGLLIEQKNSKQIKKEPGEKVHIIIKSIKEGKIFFNLDENKQ